MDANKTKPEEQKPVEKIYFYSSSKKILTTAAEESSDKESVTNLIKEKLKSSLRSENLIVLTGAGSSIGFGGKSMYKIWDQVESELTEFSEILRSIEYSDDQKSKKNLEYLLSVLQIEKQNLENKSQDNSLVTKYIDSIEAIILRECSFVLPDAAPHDIFIKKLLKARKNIDPRIKIFTLNYDRAFETAADRLGAVLIDGFSFSQKQTFNAVGYDLDIVYREKSRIHSEESFFSKVIHLYKVHGSVTWSKDEHGLITKENKPVTDSKTAVLIYPNSSKYEKSYEMPFFEMVGRFQNVLRKENTTFLIIGYGFNDEHINRILKESIKSNTNLEVFVVNPLFDLANPCVFEMKEWIDKGLNDLHFIGMIFEEFVKIIPEVIFDDQNIREKIVKK